MPIKATTDATLSIQEPRFFPAITPRGMAMRIAMNKAAMAS
jgi:hypothetical protein